MSSIRITGGSLKGRKIPVPAAGVRPTSSRARQAYFDIVSDRVPQSVFLDLFSGSGIFSFEALSRGAAEAWSIDRSPRAAKMIQRLAGQWGLSVHPITSEVLAGIRHLPPSLRVDLVYADPPFDYEEYPLLLTEIDSSPLLSPGAIVAVERPARGASLDDAGLRRLRHRKTARYGRVAIDLFDTMIAQF